jgi:chromosome segregation ATPase
MTIQRLERERRLEQLAQCPEGHDTRHYYGWLDDIEESGQQIAALRTENNTMQRTTLSLQAKLDALQAEIGRMRNKRDGLEQDWYALESGAHKAVEQIAALTAELSDLKGQLLVKIPEQVKIAALQAEIAILKTKNAGWIKFSCDHRCELRKKLDVSQDVGMQESMEVVRLQASLAVSDKAAIEWQHRCTQIDMELSTAKAHIKELEDRLHLTETGGSGKTSLGGGGFGNMVTAALKVK